MSNLENELKRLIISALNLEDLEIKDIESSEPLFGDGLGLDSIDALELGVAIQKKYGVKFDTNKDNVKEIFYSVGSLSQHLKERI